MDFDTSFWDEIQDSHAEIFDLDIPELFEEDDSDDTWISFVNSNVTL